jgi:ketosteroid isomerase-like protein
MKTIVISLFILVLSGCTSQKPKPLTDAEKASIIKEVSEVNQAAFDAYNKIDFQTVKSLFLDSPDFIGVSSDGSILNFEQVINKEKGFFESVSSLHLTKISEDNKVLERDLVIAIVQFKTDATLKSGKNLTFEKLTVTNIFRKIDNQWKSIFYQESALPPVVVGS